MAARLTKAAGRCKGSAALLLACIGVATAAGAAEERDLRDCVAQADGAAAVASCERRQQESLKDRIDRWTRAIPVHLDRKARLAFERNATAWQTFFDSEVRMLQLTLQNRRDGLGGSLYSGAVTRLYEQRERQLREHLHNLKFVGQRAPDASGTTQ